MNYLEFAKAMTRAQYEVFNPVTKQWDVPEATKECDGEYQSCPCAAHEQARLDHWADQQMDEQREARR